MSDQLDSQQIQTVLAAGENYNRVQDHQQAYDTVFPLVDGGTLHGDDLGRGEVIVGEACVGLGSYDAALHYIELALQHASGDSRARAETMRQHLQHLDAAQGVAQDGVDGEQEAEALLRVGEEAVERNDFDAAWSAFSDAYNGLRLSRAQLSRAALGMAACYLHAGQATETEGYLQVAENQDPTGLQQRIDALRMAAATIRSGRSALDGGVDRTDLDEVNRAALEASRAHDVDTAYDLFLQMYESPALPASDRGRVALNLAILCLYSHSYDAARQYLDDAVATGRADTAQQASTLIQQLAGMDRAAEIVADIDLGRDIADVR